MRKNILLLLSCFIITNYGLAQCPRATIISNYNNVYLPTAVNTVDLGWTGSTATCTPGTISDTAMNRSLRRINYFRNLVGVTPNIVYDTSYSRKAQEAALIMSANGMLSHNPDSTWLCYTGAGDTAAGSSNISLGSNSSGAISSFMNDNGSGNTAAGHRRWILYSRATKFGMGSTDNACDLWVFGPTVSPPPISFYAYPSPGFFPAPLLPSSRRWSFSIPGANFSNATVDITDPNGVSVLDTIETVANGYGDNTLVWQTTSLNTTGPYDEKYTVTVSNVSGSTATTYTYDVIIAQPIHPPSCPNGLAWSENDCACINNVGIADISSNHGISIISNPFSDNLQVRLNAEVINEIQIFNYAGSMIDAKIISGKDKTIEWNTGTWSKGIYILLSKDVKGNVYQKKIVKM